MSLSLRVCHCPVVAHPCVPLHTALHVTWHYTLRTPHCTVSASNCNFAKFVWSCLNSQNCVIKNIALSAKSSSSSDFGDNYRYRSYPGNN